MRSDDGAASRHTGAGAGPRRTARRSVHTWVPRVAGIATLLIGLLDIMSGLRHGLRDRIPTLVGLVPGVITSAASAFTVIIGILLVLLAHALRRRKRRAWRIVVALLAVGVAAHVLRGHTYVGAGISAALLVGLIVYRGEFYALGDPRTRLRAVGFFVGMALASTALGLAAVSVRPAVLAVDAPFPQRLEHVVFGLVGVTGPLQFASERYADFISFLLLALGALTALVTAYLALRPEEPVAALSAEDEARMRALLDRHGHRDSLGYFGLRRDKSVIWSPTGKSAVAYRVVSGVMLASGDPLGDPEAWPGAIAAFLDEADRHAWVPAVMGCSETGGEVWCREGDLDALELGDEAVVDVADFSLEGRAMRNVRQMVGRVQRAGYSCEARRVREIPPDEREQIARQAAAWRTGEAERGFSMALGRIGDPADGDCVLVTASKDGQVRAFLHFVPWGADGLSLDLMRRDRDADAGLNDLLIVSALQAAPELGVARVSLNFAVFRAALERGERLGAGPVLRLWRRVLVFLSRWFQIESLYRFNAKFQPRWLPRFLVYPSAGDLPRIAFAAMEAEAFVTVPHPFDRRSEAEHACPHAETGDRLP